MQALKMSKYIINILFLLFAVPAFAQVDDEAEDPPPTPKYVDSFHQIRFGVDILKPVINTFLNSQRSYEFEVDYYLKKDIYAVAEGGWGSAEFNTDPLSYNSSNSFAKIGINKGMLARMSSKDWDMGFIGARYGIAPIHRGAANYITKDAFWGNVSGTIPADDMIAHWFEVTGGVRVEVVKCLFLGWNIRGKFRLNQGRFKELPPSYIAGYGMGDKNSIFDFNFYVNYAIRWRKGIKSAKPVEAPAPAAPTNIQRATPPATK
jgi:hypothetical protein